MSERVQRLVLGMVFLWAPLAFFPPAAEGFTLTKELLAASGLAFLMASIDAGTWRRALADGVVRAALVLAAWMFGVSLFTAPSKAEVFRGIVHTLLLGGSVAAATLWVLSRPEAWRRALALSVLAGGIMALLGILQGMGLDRALHWTSRFDGRVFSTMGNPNYLGGHLAAVLPPAFLLALSARGGRRALWGGIAALLFAALLLSRVRGAFLATAASFTLLGLLFAAPWGRPLARPNRGLLLSGYAVALLAGLLTVASLGGFSIFSLRGETARQRLDTWQAAWLMVKDRPLLGWGVEQLKVLYPAYQHRPFKPEGYARHPYTYTEHVHNEFLRIHLEGGLAGLALFLALLFLHARALARRLSDPSLGDADRALLIGSAGGVAAVLVQSLSNFPLQISPTTVLFGLFLAGPAAAGGGTVSPGAWRGFGRPLAVTALVLLVGTRALAASVAFRNLAGELQLGNARQASEFGRRLLSLDPGHSKGWFNYGKALEAERLPATAIEAYQRAARENPYYVEALAAEAAVQLQNGQPIPAFVAAEKAAGIAPNYAGPHFIRGTALFGFGRFGEAANAFRAALLVVPDHFDSWLNLGTCLIKDGDRDGAVAAWRRALELKPGDPTATSYLRANQAIP